MNIRKPVAITRYLAAKRTIDDRAINQRIFETFREAVLRIPKPVNFLEVGAGLGTGFTRLLKKNVFQKHGGGHYDLVDRHPEILAQARNQLRHVISPLTLNFHNEDINHFVLQSERQEAYDVLIAHAVVDLIDAAHLIPKLIDLVRIDGVLYFPITFDGESIFEPAHIDDNKILNYYHSTMDMAGGDSKAGRHLFHILNRAGAHILDVGSSDWVIFPVAGTYPADEAYFLTFIIETIRHAVAESSVALQETVHAWAEARLASIKTGELVYIAHQLDYLCAKELRTKQQ